MHLKPETIEKVNQLSKDPAYGAFFEELANLDIPTDILNEINDIFTYEMELRSEKRHAFMLALRLAFLAGRVDNKPAEAQDSLK